MANRKTAFLENNLRKARVLGKRKSRYILSKMTYHAVGVPVSVAFFFVVAVVGLKYFAGPGPNRGYVFFINITRLVKCILTNSDCIFCRLLQTLIVTTCLCLWLFYIIAYLAQLNPLIAPVLKVKSVYIIDP